MSRNDVVARRAKVISLINSGVIHSQDDVVQELKRAGFEVTQATASRDLDEVGAIRTRDNDGNLMYTLGSSEPLARSMPVPAELIISVESSANLAVVKTPPGGAQLLASSIDHIGLTGVIGTIAGDDTVLVVSKRATGGAYLAKELLSYKKRESVVASGSRGKKTMRASQTKKGRR